MTVDASFKIGSSLQADGGYDAEVDDVLSLQLEATSAAGIERCVYSIAMSTKDATAPVFNPVSGIASPPTGVVTLTMPATGVHSYLVRCVINNGVNARGEVVAGYTKERVVAIRSDNGRRKIVPTERDQYDPVYGWIDEVNETAMAITESGGGGGSSAVVTGTYDCDAGVAVRDLVYLASSNTVNKADASDAGTLPIVGFVTSKPTSTTCVVCSYGEVTGFSGLTARSTYYASATAGAITATLPTTPDIVKRVGFAKTSTVLMAMIDMDHYQL